MSLKPHPLQTDFVKLVQHEMVDSGLRAMDLCRKAGVTQSHWSMIENGKRNLTLSVVAKIAKALKKKPTITLN